MIFAGGVFLAGLNRGLRVGSEWVEGIGPVSMTGHVASAQVVLVFVVKVVFIVIQLRRSLAKLNNAPLGFLFGLCGL